MQADELISVMIRPRDVRQLSMAAMHAVMALRLCVICHKVGRNPMDDLIQRFGNPLAVRHFRFVFEAIGTAWPDPFTISRPCCPLLSPDEAMFADMMTSVARRDRAAFDSVTHEMHGSDAREALYATLSAFERVRQDGLPFTQSN